MPTHHVEYANHATRLMQFAADEYATFLVAGSSPVCLVADGIERGILIALACPEWAWAAIREDSSCDCGDACTAFEAALQGYREWVARHPLPQTETH